MSIKAFTSGKVYTEINEGITQRVVRFRCPHCAEHSMSYKEYELFHMCGDCAHAEMTEHKF